MKSIEKFKEQNGIKDNGLQEFFELTLTSYDFKEEVPFDNVGDQYYDLINENPEARMLDEKDILVLLKADAKQIDGFLEFNGNELLTDAGKISHEEAKLHAETEFEKYRIIQDKLFESDFDKFMIDDYELGIGKKGGGRNGD